MKKITLVIIITILVSWLALGGFFHFQRSSKSYTDMLLLAVEENLMKLQSVSKTLEQAQRYIDEKNASRIWIDQKYYYELGVIECNGGWYAVAIPSKSERYLVEAPKRFVLLNFSKVQYPIFVADPNGRDFTLHSNDSAVEIVTKESLCSRISRQKNGLDAEN